MPPGFKGDTLREISSVDFQQEIVTHSVFFSMLKINVFSSSKLPNIIFFLGRSEDEEYLSLGDFSLAKYLPTVESSF